MVILVSGSGAQDRNEEIAGHKTFMVIADYLTQNGIAVFRYDDRGIAESKGDFANSTTYDFMTDTEAVLNYFYDFPNIDKTNIGVLGHSEGGLIAFMLAAKETKKLNFIISLAGPGVPIKELLVQQLKDVNKSFNFPDEHIEVMCEMQSEILDIATKNVDMYELRKNIKIIYDKYAQHFTEEERQKYQIGDAAINVAVMQLSSPWMKYFIKIDPGKYIKKVKCRVLSINGSTDLQVKMEDNLNSIEKNLKTKKEVQIVAIEGLNHLFQKSETGAISEYYTIQNTIEQLVLDKIVEFIK